MKPVFSMTVMVGRDEFCCVLPAVDRNGRPDYNHREALAILSSLESVGQALVAEQLKLPFTDRPLLTIAYAMKQATAKGWAGADCPGGTFNSRQLRGWLAVHAENIGLSSSIAAHQALMPVPAPEFS